MKKLLLAAAIAASSTGLTSVANADLSANVGYVSDYFFRGIEQADSSASAGLDYEEGGLYVGVWAADVANYDNGSAQDGLEIDFYFGYGLEIEGVALGVGFTTYQYTGTFDTQYDELNLSAGFGPVSVEYSTGTHDVVGGADEDYTFIGVTGEYESFYATYGQFSQDWGGSYIEVGYGTEVGGFDVGVALIGEVEAQEAGDLNGIGDARETLVFSLGKSFDL